MDSIYVETHIHAELEELWRFTQDPAVHARWDLRFTEISYLPKATPREPQRFLYETRIGFGLRIRGEGESVGTRGDATGMRTSALKFWSDDPRSLILRGSGYWQYVPGPGGVRFLTRYDYQTRFGPIGRLIDRLVFRPLLRWATAWSFDRLRLWLEKGIDPSVSLQRSLLHAVSRGSLAAAWLYQGVVPKLLFPEGGEVAIVRAAGVLPGSEELLVTVMGSAEALLGLFMLLLWRSHLPLLVSLLALPALLVAGVASMPGLLVAPFNPASLTLTMVALAAVASISSTDLPSSAACLRRPPGDTARRA